MRSLLCLPLVALSLACGRAEAPPQARPVQAWLAAVSNHDSGLLQEASSLRLRKTWTEGGPEHALNRSSERLRERFGNFRIADFDYSYRGTERQGEVLLIYRGQDTGETLRVVQEGPHWKVDQG